jgi:hypothetical protein
MKTRVRQFVYTDTLLEDLSEYRQTWEDFAEGEPLVQVSASLGMVLYDLAERLEVMGVKNPYAFLGEKLLAEVREELSTGFRVKTGAVERVVANEHHRQNG